MKIGILTGGGDCPGLNPVIRAIVRKSCLEKDEIVGIRYGWKGLLENDAVALDMQSVSGILHKGGTILGTSRTNPYKKGDDGVEVTKKNFKALGLDALVAIGGEDTLGVAAKLFGEGINVVGVPKTIDNDLGGTDFTFGFDTAINIVTECIDRLHTTAESHDRIMVVEVMGRHAGWIAAYAGIAGGADYILIPELPVNIEEVCECLKTRHDRGKNFSIVVVSEGAFFDNENLCLQEQKLDELKDTGAVTIEGLETSIPAITAIEAEVDNLKSKLEPAESDRKYSDSELKMLKKALEVEIETSEFYNRMVNELPDDGQKLFQRFVEIEEGHKAIVQAEIDAVTGMGYWFDMPEFDLAGN